MDRLYVDTKSKKALITLQIPKFTRSVRLNNSANEKFLENPAVTEMLDKSYVLYQAYKSNINSSLRPRQNRGLIVGASQDDPAITARKKQLVKDDALLSEDDETKEGKKPVKYSFTMSYGRVNGRRA